MSILDIGKGMVLGGSGQAEFVTRYRAIVFKPFKGEVVDGVVNNVNKVCSCICYCLNTLEGQMITRGFGFKMGFFADVGPLAVFVSHQVSHSACPLSDTIKTIFLFLSAYPSRHEIRSNIQPTIFRVGRTGRAYPVFAR